MPCWKTKFFVKPFFFRRWLPIFLVWKIFQPKSKYLRITQQSIWAWKPCFSRKIGFWQGWEFDHRVFNRIDCFLWSIRFWKRSNWHFSKTDGSESIPLIFKKDQRSTGAIRSFGIKKGKTVKNKRKMHFFWLNRSFIGIERSIPSKSTFQNWRDRFDHGRSYLNIEKIERSNSQPWVLCCWPTFGGGGFIWSVLTVVSGRVGEGEGGGGGEDEKDWPHHHTRNRPLDHLRHTFYILPERGRGGGGGTSPVGDSRRLYT